MANEPTPEEMFNKMMEQQKAMATPPDLTQTPNQPLGADLPNAAEQSLINSIQNQPAPILNDVKPTQGECSECGMFHPPTGGKPCPNASTVQSTTGQKIDDSKVNAYLVQWKNIMLAHIQKVGIEDWNKAFQEATLLFAKEFDGNKKDV